MIQSAMRGNWTLLAAALTGVVSCLVARESLRRLMEYETLSQGRGTSRWLLANAAEVLADLSEEDSTTS